MAERRQRKVGIIPCSGEDCCEGTVARLAALKVLHDLRPEVTETICLPLLALGEDGAGDFAQTYPTIAVDGCGLRCAARAIETYSGKPAATVVVCDIVADCGLWPPAGRRRLNDDGKKAVAATAERIAAQVDAFLGQAWSHRKGMFITAADTGSAPPTPPFAGDGKQPAQETCPRGSRNLPATPA